MTGFLLDVQFTVEGTKEAQCFLNMSENIDVVSAPFTGGRKVIEDIPGVTKEVTVTYEQLRVLPEKTDIWASAIGPSGGAGVSCRFDIVMLSNLT